ncbi:MAG: hypothetical protein A2Z20_03480 [Bdellovibrionales bacterium RBG_16_40_8]|nr:MAG: hypothetical protein A2Z20_03480 [Bdellovibrionales bacterium RBG_16_40_8]
MKHWVFDLDGTLIDSEKYYELSIKTILGEFEIIATADDIDLAYKFFNPEDYFATYFQDAQKIQQATQRLADLNKIYANKLTAFEDVEGLLIYLRSKDVNVSVWTGRETETAKKILNDTGLAKHIGICVGRTCVPKNKPHPDGLLKILMDSRSHGDNVLMVGDHEYDMQGARAAKVKAVSVNWGKKTRHNARAISDHHFENVSDLLFWTLNLYK